MFKTYRTRKMFTDYCQDLNRIVEKGDQSIPFVYFSEDLGFKFITNSIDIDQNEGNSSFAISMDENGWLELISHNE